MRYDVIVIGVGGMGSAAAYHLARRGARVLGLERYDIPHDLGSSHGVNRIIRLAYAEHPSYVPLLRRALRPWPQRDKTTRGRPLVLTGWLLACPPARGPVVGARHDRSEHRIPPPQPLVGPCR